MTAPVINSAISDFIGARLEGDGVRFRVWAPASQRVDVQVEADEPGLHPLEKSADGYFTAVVPGLRAGTLYRYRVDGGDPFPDPASRFQPQGVHGPSEVVDSAFHWTDAHWRGIDRRNLIIYELHVGTFTDEGTFDAAREKLPDLLDLGVTAIELLPLAQCPGQRNWGYDGVDLFAPACYYGRPDDLRRFVDEAHRLGLAVILDVVYNHLGPDGNYLGVYSPYYVNDRHHTDWGAAHNFDGPHNRPVRDFFIGNAVYWVRDFHFDGLRLDATHVIEDDSPKHVLAELAERVRAVDPSRVIHVIAEDNRNENRICRPASDGGWNHGAVWADGLHHHLRRFFTGDCESYYCDYSGTAADISKTIERGWFYRGEMSKFFGKPRGTDPTPLDYSQFVVSLQNHDQIGNRALGDRLNHTIELAEYRAASALLLTCPLTPLLYMGQEWGATSPFLYFTDHNEELGKQVTAGRRNEFRHFAAFNDPQAQKLIPDPQAASTFERSKLRWQERDRPPHAGILRLYHELLRLRRNEPALWSTRRIDLIARALDEQTVALRRSAGAGAIVVVVRLRGQGEVQLAGPEWKGLRFDVVMTSEDDPFGPDTRRPEITLSDDPPRIRFFRAAAVILRGMPKT